MHTRPSKSSVAHARAAGLRYATDAEPGILRRRSGPGFLYRDANGHPVSEKARQRIRALVIPPAWTNVWIAPDARAHLQATGRDARGRKQYRYHARWSAVRDGVKYDRLREVARALPSIRRRIVRDLRTRPLSRSWVLATVSRLLERSVIRIGNEEYRRANGSYGLTTLRNRHVDLDGQTLTLKFRAKSGVQQVIEVVDERLARNIARLQALPGGALFQFLDDEGRLRSLSSADVNAYLRGAAAVEFSAKDFRTWAGTLEVSRALDRSMVNRPASDAARKRELVRAVDAVARRLGNTRAVCRKSYVHPAVLDHYFNGRTLKSMQARATGPAGLSRDERALLALLELREAQAKSA